MLFYYLLSSLGLCFILKYSTLLRYARNFLVERSILLKELFNCSMCLGFWCGVALIPFLYKYENYKIVAYLYPFASSSFCWVIDVLMDAMVAIVAIAREERKEDEQKHL